MTQADVQATLGEPHVVRQHLEPARPRENDDHEWCLTGELFDFEQPAETWLYTEADRHTLAVQFEQDGTVLSVASSRRQ